MENRLLLLVQEPGEKKRRRGPEGLQARPVKVYPSREFLGRSVPGGKVGSGGGGLETDRGYVSVAEARHRAGRLEIGVVRSSGCLCEQRAKWF
jgi:hypothetical protein